MAYQQQRHNRTMGVLSPLKTALSIIASILILPALAQPKLTFEDPNPGTENITEYSVWDITGGAFGGARVLSFVIPAEPKSGDLVNTVRSPLPASLVGKTITVTAKASSGLESIDAVPSLTLPPLAFPPSNLILSLNRETGAFILTWADTNPAIAKVSRYRVFRLVNGLWTSVGDVTDKSYTIPANAGGRYAVTAINLWGPSPQSISIETPTNPRPVTGLRVVEN